MIDERSFPWTRIFTDLEKTLPPGVRVVSISPRPRQRPRGSSPQVGVTSDEAEIRFLEAVEKSRVFSGIQVDQVRPVATAGGPDKVLLTLRYGTQRYEQNWHNLEDVVGAALGLLLAADSLWAFFSGSPRGKIPHSLRARRDRLATQVKLLKADVARGERSARLCRKSGKTAMFFTKHRSSTLSPATRISRRTWTT